MADRAGRPAGLALNCITWNVHRGRGANDRYGVDADRIYGGIEGAVAPLQPHILALQEADEELPPHARIIDPGRIAGALGLVHAQCDLRLRTQPGSSGFFGSVLFVHPDFEISHSAVLDLPGHWHRGAVALETTWYGAAVRILTVHLSRLEVLRVAQMRTLGQFMMRRPQMPTLFLGDTNDWRLWTGLAFSRAIVGTRLAGPRTPTFPVARPILSLDRIMVDAPFRVETVRALDSPQLRQASDHRPLWGQVLLQR